MNAASVTLLRLKFAPWRARLLLVLLLAALALLVGRAAYLQGAKAEFLKAQGAARYLRVIPVSAQRGRILDRNSTPLAISTPVQSIWADLRELDLRPHEAPELARLLGLSEAALRQAQAQRDPAGKPASFVYLKRQLPPAQAARVLALGIPGLHAQREVRRYYPAAEVTAHLLGFTNVDDRGQEGLELAFQSTLAAEPGKRRVLRDNRRFVIEDMGELRVPTDGRDLRLSIDLNLQYLAYRELARTVEENKALAGGVIILDARSGEILALANVPTYNPNDRSRYNRQRARNRALVDQFEPGSTLKPFTAAAALEAGIVTPDTVIDTAPGYFRVGRRVIRDIHREDELTVAQVIQKSSNVGAAKMALALEPEFFWEALHGLGFGAAPQTGFPGEAAGRLRPYATWKPIEQATMSYGHGISVSLAQIARAYTVFTSDGFLLPLSLVRRDVPPAGTRVMTADTSRTVRAMLELVTQTGGTATQARVPGYRVGGKTGTAHKLVNGQYAKDRYLASFVGIAPVSDPRLIVAVMIDEPRGKNYYGGLVAAPLFSRLTGSALRALGVPPDAPPELAGLPAALALKD